MADNRAILFFKEKGLENRVKIMEESTASAIEAAQALNVDLGMIAKSLTFRTDERPVLIVMSGDAKIDSKKFRQTFKVKSKMLDAEDVEKYTGYTIGGVCPFNLISDEIDVYLDKSLERFETLYPGCGDHNALVEVKLDELKEFSNYLDWVDIGKDW
ncbi:prolyl-tRNA editing enzyme YbaK/EbsC (Cys-tRNA(Pro) deacylase) [Bacilli bacterium PM5-3]|nr:prolyl-tRNA editing enzyme YbaK/EbsC (Cys-tRNA(Pro) deacylase) [Bacilli bacterium PM5-3]MDH6603910.1 prolyl-tRNA editing enzyme YbaK/EbsC (Cys-tRNA(Pro) deacylase) [Bacilli bacterium PM5-9]